MNELRWDTYCGLNCGACPVGMANESEDEEYLQRMSEEWGIAREELGCRGCKTDITAGFCTRCSMRACAIEKGIEFCWQCDEYPCRELTAFQSDEAPHHSAVISNLERIRTIGMERWLAEQRERWSCPGCGTRFNWYSEKCSECGEELCNAVSEEKDLQS